MGSGVSSNNELSTDEKIQIAKTLQQKYAEANDNEQMEDLNLFEVLKETYEKLNVEIMEKRSLPSVNPTSSTIDLESNGIFHGPSTDFFDDVDHKGLKTPTDDIITPMNVGGSFSSKMTTINSSEQPSIPGKLTRARTSSQLLSMASEAVLDDQQKIANFISQLKAGELQTTAASDFRTRRLTFSQNTQDTVTPITPAEPDTPVVPKSTVKRIQSRTTIFASSEIGVVQEKKPPFPNEILGTYSCHGIEPSMDEEDGIHEKINQDRGCIVYPYNSKRNEALLMCLDGHGEEGDKVSEFVMRQIVVSLEKDPALETDPTTALKNSYIMTNTALMVTDIRYMTSGCTCVTIYARGNMLYVANVGDSRAVMAWENEAGEFIARDMTRDHKPDDPEEEARITAWGGFVCPPQDVGLSARVYLDAEFTMIGLAMARSIGDHAVKAVGVIPEPEVTIFEVQSSDRFMLMASDGVWEFITSQEAVDIVQSNMHLGCHGACQELIETAAARWQEEEGDYRDDITAVIVRVPLPYY